MESELLEHLPLVQRLAWSYAPRAARVDTLTLLVLDNRLSGILRARSEPIIAQVKLAWWRDRLSEDPDKWPGGEPLLERLEGWNGDTRRLGALVDGWEILLADQLERQHIDEFAHGRSAAWQALGLGLGAADTDLPRIGRAARGWALADLALNVGDTGEAALARSAALEEGDPAPRLPGALRPLAVLAALSRRALRRNATELLDGPGAAMLALRIGMSGR